MEFTTIVRERTEASGSQFWKAVDIWCRNPHVANRRILASKEILTIEIRDNVTEIFRRVETFNFSSLIAESDAHEINAPSLLSALHIMDYHQLRDFSSLAEAQDGKTYLRVAKLLPRTAQIFSVDIEFTFIQKGINRATSVQKSLSTEKRPVGPGRIYAIQLHEDGYTSISVYRAQDTEEICDPSVEWLKQKLFPRLLNWMRNETRNLHATPASLSLVSAERYARLYSELKKKYGAEMVKTWPENTDPAKFVYEDVAIAVYLLLLWEKERIERGTDKLQSFLDLGCGNGLLVHILFSEGHQGTGIDLRKRKIWDSYPSGTPLQVRTIVPSSATVFPNVDWIIGNHSDELTPWIPVIAARSSADCRFFLLPCCPYEFDGSKYQRYCSSKSQYSEYIDYVKSVCEGCGFKTQIDKLRIPSTKRICLVGWERMHGEEEDLREKRIREMINAKTALIQVKDPISSNESVQVIDDTDSSWSCGFQPRDTVEKVRNCTGLDKTLLTEIVNNVADQLLHEGPTILLEQVPGKTWNAGRRLELREIAESISREKLRQLRKECGGLQTLLKNRSDVFRVTQGMVEFRIPGRQRVDERKNRRRKVVTFRSKVKPCWFHENHPDGCPATEINCNYKH